MLDILPLIPAKKRKTSNGWVVFNGICCHHLGHNPDTRSRAGVCFTDTQNWLYHCFNCQFKCGFTLGKPFSSRLKQLLQWCGLDQLEVDRLSLKNMSYGSVLDLYKKNNAVQEISFKEVSVPEDARLVTSQDSVLVEYLGKRGLTTDSHPFYTVDNELRQRIIIPYFYKQKMVGFTSRYLDNRHPKYVSEQQRGYVFNIDNQKPEWTSCILVEGQFDAISIGGCAYMSSNINEDQARLLRSLHKRIIVVPDHDKAGLSICDFALEMGFSVSIPEWSNGVKDVNDAVVKYGKLSTVLSILRAATMSKIKVEMMRKKING